MMVYMISMKKTYEEDGNESGFVVESTSPEVTTSTAYISPINILPYVQVLFSLDTSVSGEDVASFSTYNGFTTIVSKA